MVRIHTHPCIRWFSVNNRLFENINTSLVIGRLHMKQSRVCTWFHFPVRIWVRNWYPCRWVGDQRTESRKSFFWVDAVRQRIWINRKIIILQIFELMRKVCYSGNHWWLCNIQSRYRIKKFKKQIYQLQQQQLYYKTYAFTCQKW